MEVRAVTPLEVATSLSVHFTPVQAVQYLAK